MSTAWNQQDAARTVARVWVRGVVACRICRGQGKRMEHALQSAIMFAKYI